MRVQDLSGCDRYVLWDAGLRPSLRLFPGRADTVIEEKTFWNVYPLGRSLR